MDLFQVNIESVLYFRFLLPASAVGVDSDMVLEISVDYGMTSDKTEHVANAWARKQDGITKCFISSVKVPLGDDEQERIFNELNESEEFKSRLVDFIHHLEKHH